MHAKVFGSETAVQVPRRPHARGRRGVLRPPPAARGLVQDALAYPLFSGGNIGFRRRRLQALLADPGYDPWSTVDD